MRLARATQAVLVPLCGVVKHVCLLVIQQRSWNLLHRYLHTQISLVSQEPVLFAETIRFNITFGLPDGDSSVTQEEVRRLSRPRTAPDCSSCYFVRCDSSIYE